MQSDLSAEENSAHRLEKEGKNVSARFVSDYNMNNIGRGGHTVVKFASRVC